MENDTSTIISAEVADQDYPQANWIAKEKGQAEISAVIELTDDEKIDIVAARILKRFRPAFEELAK